MLHGDRIPEDSRPVTASHAHLPEPVGQLAEIGFDPLARVPKVRELPVDPLARVPKVRELFGFGMAPALPDPCA